MQGHRLKQPGHLEADVEGHVHAFKPPGPVENVIRLGFDDDTLVIINGSTSP